MLPFSLCIIQVCFSLCSGLPSVGTFLPGGICRSLSSGVQRQPLSCGQLTCLIQVCFSLCNALPPALLPGTFLPFFPSVSFLVKTAYQSSGATFDCNKDPSDDRSAGKECASSSARSFTVLGSRGKYTVAFSSCRYTSIVLCASQRPLRITSSGQSVAIGRNVAPPARREPRSRHFSP